MLEVSEIDSTEVAGSFLTFTGSSSPLTSAVTRKENFSRQREFANPAKRKIRSSEVACGSRCANDCEMGEVNSQKRKVVIIGKCGR